MKLHFVSATFRVPREHHEGKIWLENLRCWLSEKFTEEPCLYLLRLTSSAMATILKRHLAICLATKIAVIEAVESWKKSEVAKSWTYQRVRYQDLEKTRTPSKKAWH